MRLPLDRRSMAVESELEAARELFWARSALTFVLMTVIKSPFRHNEDVIEVVAEYCLGGPGSGEQPHQQ